MGITKTEGFNTKTVAIAEQLKAIGHPARWAIMEYLAFRNECICGDIVDAIPLAQPTISRHLSELKKAGLIKGNISGNNICYCIDLDQWNNIITRMQELAQRCCGDSCC